MTSAACEQPDTECSVCNNNFVEPKILPCGHLLCRECIISIIKSRKPRCPLCRNAIAGPEALKSRSPESIADSLPTDFVMDALVLSVDLQNQRPICCGCHSEDVESVCLQCQERLCSTCTIVHSNFSMSRSHEVKSLGTVTAESLAASRVPLCACKSDKMLFYCTSHGLAVCGSCAVKEHKSCPEMKDLDSEMNAAKEAVKVLRETLSSAEKKMEKIVDELDTCLKELHSCEKMCNCLVTICNKYTKTLKSATSRRVSNSVSDAKVNLEGRLAKVKCHARIVSRAETVCPRPELIYANQALQDRVNTLDFSATWPAEVDITSFRKMVDFKNLARQIKCEVTLQEEILEEKRLVFHKNRGCSVMLGLNETLAVCQGPSGGVVVSCHALVSDVLYQVSVMEMRRDWQSDDIKFCGITKTYPNDLNIKQRMCEMDDVQTVQWPENVDVDTSKAVGLMIDSTNSLHLFLQERDLGIASINVPRPCYAVFDLGINVTQVLALPATNMSEKSSQDMSSQYMTSQGISSQDMSSQGTSSQDMTSQGTSSQDMTSQGTSSQDMSSQGTSSQDMSSQDFSSHDTMTYTLS